MRELWGGISTKITDATGLLINGFGQFLGMNPILVTDSFSVRPVLTEEAIEGTPVIENSQILKSIFWAIGI
jgi:hypothetical protein